MRISLMASGGLGYDALLKIHAERNITFVFTDKKSGSIIEYCEKNGITCFAGDPKKGTFDHVLENSEIDILLSINYLFILPKAFIQWPKMFAVNFHGSLLPKYRGRTPHVWAIINNEKETGVTAHLIDEGCDTGAIIEQVKIPIEQNDTGNDILAKYKTVYPVLIDKVLQKIEAGNPVIQTQDETKATYFGKRTPEDGKINWKWQKERIFNWVRAQAKPYPGAFTYYQDQKITIHKIKFTDDGFGDTQPNGQILKINTNSLIIKTQNGAVEASELEYEPGITFTQEEVLR